MSIPRSDLTHGGVVTSSMQASALDQLIVSFGGTPPALLADKVTSALSALAGFETRAATDLSRFGFLVPSSSVHPPVVSGMNAGKTYALKRTTKSKSDVSSKKVKTSPDGKSSGQGSALPQLKIAPNGSTVSWAKTKFNLPALRAKWDSEHSKDRNPVRTAFKIFPINWID